MHKNEEKKKSHFNNYGYHDALDPIPSFCLDSIYWIYQHFHIWIQFTNTSLLLYYTYTFVLLKVGHYSIIRYSVSIQFMGEYLILSIGLRGLSWYITDPSSSFRLDSN